MYEAHVRDEYEIFWCEFLVNMFHWFKRLEEAPEYEHRQRIIVPWTVVNLIA